MMVLGGKGHYTIGDVGYYMKKGQVYLVSNGCPHSAFTDPKHTVHLFSMRFGIYDHQTGKRIDHFFPQPFGLKVEAVSKSFEVLLKDCFHHFLDPGPTSPCHIDVKMKHLLLNLLDHMEEEGLNTTADRMTAPILRSHGVGISLRDLANSACLSEKQYTRQFLKATNTTPHQYILRIRMNQAKHLLEDTDLTIHAIAGELGYADAFTFSRQFKKTVGISPNLFRSSIP